jgi:RNA polymerase sigma factor (sigma-70 family)
MNPVASKHVPGGGCLDGEFDSLPTRRSLLSRLRDVGDDASWRTFFDAYWRLIYNVARKSGLDDDAAQEVVQETVICVARRMPAFRYEPAKGSFKNWLLLITRRRIHDHLRGRYRQPATSGEATEEIVAPTLPPDAAIDAAWEAEWRGNIFQMALERVRGNANPKHYQVFDYCVLQGMRAPAVARLLGLNTAQVYLARHRVSAAVKRAAAEIEAGLGKGETR